MHDLVLFCKTYRKDFKNFKILKESIDKYNADNIPFCVVCPEADLKKFKGLISNNENYEIIFVTDEEVLKANKIEHIQQNWDFQQIIKLGFFKLNLCENYSVLDSDMYFIQNFYIKDFMYDKNTPYLFLKEFYNYEEIFDELKKIQDFIGRKGKTYYCILQLQVFSKKVLQDMEEHLLKEKNMTLEDIIQISPYEFNWYGEWFLKYYDFHFHFTSLKLKTFWNQQQYLQARLAGETLQDFINQGYIAILMQNRWTKSLRYKKHLFYRILKVINHTYSVLNEPPFRRRTIVGDCKWIWKNLVIDNIKMFMFKSVGD